jgi:hypothetical protein
MSANAQKHQNQLKEWSERITERTGSGMTIKAWCAEKGIREGLYHYWLKRVREDAAGFSMKKEAKAARRKLKLTNSEAPDGWALVMSNEPTAEQPDTGKEGRSTSDNGTIAIEFEKFRIIATTETDECLLRKVLRTLVAV